MTSLWRTLRRAAVFALFSVVCSSSNWAQQATANRNVILRRDPATSSPALEHFRPVLVACHLHRESVLSGSCVRARVVPHCDPSPRG